MAIPKQVLDWLLEPDELSVHYGALVDLLDEPPDSTRARRARGAIRRSARAQALLAGQQDDGGFTRDPYNKWRGSHWRLLRLAELDYPPGDRAVKRAIENALPWALSHEPTIIAGRPRRCASQQGAAVYYCVRLGYGDDARVRTLVERLISWQWPDGGWNCDRRPEADHSSFHETLLPLRGLAEYWRMTGDGAVESAVERAGELLLCHHLFRRDHDPKRRVIDPDFTRLRYPTYWHYDIVDACRALATAGRLDDPRVGEAIDLVESKRRPDGAWAPENRYWKPPTAQSGPTGGSVEAVTWSAVGRGDKFLTLNALRVLRAAGRV
ncbi:hypothetical protein AMK68_00915 [candidate division KD3-62 bacterium DG_56]|uniref:Squalene cyclase C-terminal domain-containing protein n=1 Tax=candidate division KD3-62 bacterium DG_56 TaxID=1704032 RepID=A0A0S7XQC8_9BACT|nr:MAG: hypothetical protein AMK68_00915 [candidate division KD3-62 bacterium DG_56]